MPQKIAALRPHVLNCSAKARTPDGPIGCRCVARLSYSMYPCDLPTTAGIAPSKAVDPLRAVFSVVFHISLLPSSPSKMVKS